MRGVARVARSAWDARGIDGALEGALGLWWYMWCRRTTPLTGSVEGPLEEITQNHGQAATHRAADSGRTV